MKIIALPFLALAPLAAGAQQRDTVRLADLHARALATDPRAAQVELLGAQSSLRRRNLAAERLPSLSLEAQAQHQSDVTALGITLPGGVRPPTTPYDTYDARLVAQQRLYDPTLGARRSLEETQLAEQRARVRVALYAARQQVNDAYFTSLRAQTQVDELRIAVADLEAQLRLAAVRVREGSALPSEEHSLRAEILRRRQALDEWESNHRAALDVLADLTGTPLDSAVALSLPDLAGAVAALKAQLGRDTVLTPRTRPEFEQFSRTQEALAWQERARAAQDRPRLTAFGRAGYGKPGLNLLGRDFDPYWLAGVQVQWSPWTWGTGRRDREVLALQRRVLATEEDAFSDRLHRLVTQDIAALDRLEVALATDDEIIALRERIAAETRARYAEGAVTSAEYIDRQSDVVSARLSRAAHRAERAQVQARFLTTMGIEVR